MEISHGKFLKEMMNCYKLLMVSMVSGSHGQNVTKASSHQTDINSPGAGVEEGEIKCSTVENSGFI